MKHKKGKPALKPSSYIILSALKEANRIWESNIEKGGNITAGAEAYKRKASEAEAMLDALAMSDPKEATLIYNACPEYFDEYIEPDEYYLGHGVFVDKTLLAELDTPEKRAAYIIEVNEDYSFGPDQSGNVDVEALLSLSGIYQAES